MTHNASPASPADSPRGPGEHILFAFGSARGGTTFLSSLLARWFSYGMGPEGTFINDIVKLANSIDDPTLEANKRRLAQAVIATPTLQIIEKRWGDEHGFSVSTEEVMALMARADAASAVYAAFDIMARKMNQARVGNKNPGYWRELDTLHNLFPDNARYLFIVRDGRDVALSLREVPWGGHSTYTAARIWRNMVRTVAEFEGRLPAGRLLRIRYEDLLGDPVTTFRKIGEFVGQDDLDTLCTRYEQAAAENRLQSNFDKWRQGMSARDQQVYEAVAGEELAQLGYARVYPQARLSLFSNAWYRLEEFLRKVKLNLYHRQDSLPLDARTSRRGLLVRLLQPGRYRKSG